MKSRNNDIIKLGRIQFRIRDLQTDTIDRNGPNDYVDNEDIEDIISSVTQLCDTQDIEEGSSLPQGRFGWENEGSKERPLINAGRCTGSVKYIHLQGLKIWVRSKVKTTTNERTKEVLESFIWKTFEGELGKKKYPYTLKSDNNDHYNIFDIDTPEDKPFIILESLAIDKNSSRMIFLIKPRAEQMEFRIGRGHESDVRVSDISVSRHHAWINYTSGKFILEDNISKFGTLVQIINKTPILKDHSCAVQAGRTVVHYTLKSSEPFLSNPLSKSLTFQKLEPSEEGAPCQIESNHSEPGD